MNKPPFIVTAGLPRDIFNWANALRKLHYPVHRNHLAAHVTLFHSFAPSLFAELKTTLPRIAAMQGRVTGRVDGVLAWERGTALAIHSPGMMAVRDQIADHFHGALTAQDLYEPRLHITIQNKVERGAAIALQNELQRTFPARDFRFTGLELHIYRAGPWEKLGHWRFRD